jgi:hypothetical protein
VAREAATGYLWLYRGNGTGGWLPRVRIGTGWQGMNLIETVGDFNGDGAPGRHRAPGLHRRPAAVPRQRQGRLARFRPHRDRLAEHECHLRAG